MARACNAMVVVAVAVMLSGGGPALVEGRNPIGPGGALADPHVHVWQDGDQPKVYVYATHDYAKNSSGFRMDDWWVWSTTDLVSWTLQDKVLPSALTWDKATTECWATDAATRNGQYYFYLSVGPTTIGVVNGSSPAGPFSDPLGKALIPAGLVKTQARDPGVLADTDGQFYLVFGTFNYFVARLAPDMVSLAEAPRPVVVNNPSGPGGKGHTDDKPFLHKRGSLYYLSWGCFYATADSPYGPFDYRGVLMDRNTTSGFYPPGWETGGGVMDRHGSFFTLHGQTYFACNDRSHGGSPYYRSTILLYAHYFRNGSIDQFRVDDIGVGEYNASSPIEAEDFFKIANASKEERAGGSGFEVVGLRDGSMLAYPKVHTACAHAQHPQGSVTIVLTVANGSPATGRVSASIATGGTGAFAECPVPSTGGWDTYKQVACTINVALGGASSVAPKQLDLELAFSGGGGQEFARLDSLQVKAC